MKHLFRNAVGITCFLIFAFTGYSQNQSSPIIADKGNLIPNDTAVIYGKLANGFTYFIRQNAEPAKRATIYLVGKAGSILEEDNERGLAHFVEHMAFNGTKHFPKHALVDYLQKAGVKFGADLNAYTSFDETVYQLPIATDSGLIENGLQIIRDWAQDVTMDDEEIDAERGVILEEKRLRKGVNERVQEITFPILMNHSRYADRLPIGDENILKTFGYETLRQFYKKWYRPDLQALVVVGDIDVKKMEKLIKEKFSDLKNLPDAPVRPDYSIILNGKNNFITITDPEIQSTSLQLLIKFPDTLVKYEKDILSSMAKSFFSSLLIQRLRDLSKNADPPFLGVNAGYANLSGGIKALTLSVGTKPGELERGFKAAFSEIERIRQTGFTQSELDRIKQTFLNEQEYRYNERDKVPSSAYVKQYVQVFLKDIPYPGQEYMHSFYKDNIDKISLSDVNPLINQYSINKNRDIILTAPETEKGKLPGEDVVLSWIKAIQDSTFQAYKEQDFSQPLIPQLPARGSVVKETFNDKTGIIEWKLSNGAKVIVKPTLFKNDQVLFNSFSPGGTSLYDDSDFQSAINAAGIVGSSGLGRFDAIALPKALSGKLVSVAPFINERYEGIKGQSSSKDLKTALELIYLYFTQAKLDEGVIQGILENARSSIQNRYLNPGNVFADTINTVLGNYNFRRLPPTLELISQIHPERSLEIFKERFSNASDFTFVFVGSCDTAVLKSLAEQYLATLPSSNQVEKWKDLGIHIPEGKMVKKVFAGKEQKASVQLVLSGKYNYTDMNNWNLKALQEILKIKLTERLREKEGGVYSPNVSISYNKFPQARYNVTISFGCAPENVDNLINATKEEMNAIVKNGPGKDDLEKYLATERMSIELALKNNNYWLNFIVNQTQNSENPDKILEINHFVDKITEASVRRTAKEYLKTNNLIEFILLPETMK